MKKLILSASLFLLFHAQASAQILCIYCYDQNTPVSTGVTNLITNGGMENHNCIPQNWFGSSYCPNSNYFNCSIANWTCTGGGSGTYADIVTTAYAQVAEGTYAAYMGNHYCNACSPTIDDTSCITDISCTIGGIPAGYPISEPNMGGATGLSLEQTVTGLTPGATYVLEFWAGGEAGQPYYGVFALNVGFGDTLLRCKYAPFPAGVGRRYIVEFIASSSSHTIKFTNWGHICNLCTEIILDNVMLYTLAELSPIVPPCPTGINELNEIITASVFPNPATNEITVETSSSQLSEFILYDISSKQLLQKSFIRKATLNILHLSKGIYFYEIKNNASVIKKGKLIKE